MGDHSDYDEGIAFFRGVLVSLALTFFVVLGVIVYVCLRGLL